MKVIVDGKKRRKKESPFGTKKKYQVRFQSEKVFCLGANEREGVRYGKLNKLAVLSFSTKLLFLAFFFLCEKMSMQSVLKMNTVTVIYEKLI